jgi:predicted transcriptional regulator
MEDVMSAVLTVRLNDDEARALDRLSQATGKTRSELVRDALRAQALRETLRLLHEELGPQARAAGWLTEDDILREVS